MIAAEITSRLDVHGALNIHDIIALQTMSFFPVRIVSGKTP